MADRFDVPATPIPEKAPAVARFEPPAAPPAVAAPSVPAPPPVAKQQATAPQLESAAEPKLKEEKPNQAQAAPSALAQLEKRSEPEKSAALDARQPAANEALRRDRAMAAPLVIASPDPGFQWRVTPQGTVERTVDGGVTWTPQDTGVPVTIHAGKSPARDVVWLVGGDGLILLSVDGRTWQRRSVGEPIALVDVNPFDALTATVTAADGRKFATRDGGLTWVHQPLQENPAAPF